MEIGKEKKTIIVEPIEDPVPRRREEPAPAPTPTKTPDKEPVKV